MGNRHSQIVKITEKKKILNKNVEVVHSTFIAGLQAFNSYLKYVSMNKVEEPVSVMSHIGSTVEP